MNWTRPFRARRAPQRPALALEPLEDRSVPAATGFPFTANSFGGGTFDPFPGFAGSVRVASGDVNGDGIADIITAQGPGGAEVRIFDGAAARGQRQAVLIADFSAYPGFAGGVFVASADFNGDGFAEVVTATGAGGQGHVKVFDFRNPAGGAFLGGAPILRASFFAYPGYLGDVQVATLNQGPGLRPVLVTASGSGSSNTDLRVYAAPLAIGGVPLGTFVQPVAQTFVFPGYLGGVTIGSGSASFGGPSRLFASTNVGVPTVGAFSLAPNGVGGLAVAPGPQFRTGGAFQADTRMAVADINGDGIAEVLTNSVGPAGAGPISALTFNGTAFTPAFASALSRFQGFGFFNGTWLGANAFGPAGVATTLTPFTTTGLAGLTTGTTITTGTGLLGGTTGLLTGGTFGGTLTGGTLGATAVGGTSGMENLTTSGLTGGTPGSFGSSTSPAFFGTAASTNLSQGVI
jgi:hypothetical protein